jgi:hypothetical protein
MEAHSEPDQSLGLLSDSAKPGSDPFVYDENVIFRESSFFKKHNALQLLLSPMRVREIMSQLTDHKTRDIARPPPVYFPGVSLLVKYGIEITIAKG